MQSSAPWDLTKPEDQVILDRIIFICTESMRICGILLQPYMPSKMKQLLDMLGVADDARRYADTSIGSDKDYGNAKHSLESKHSAVLFPPLSSHF